MMVFQKLSMKKIIDGFGLSPSATLEAGNFFIWDLDQASSRGPGKISRPFLLSPFLKDTTFQMPFTPK